MQVMSRLTSKLSTAARSMLWGMWEAKQPPKPCPKGAGSGKKAAGGTQHATQQAAAPVPCMADVAWKSRAPLLADVLAMYLECHSNPVEVDSLSGMHCSACMHCSALAYLLPSHAIQLHVVAKIMDSVPSATCYVC